MRFTPPFSPTRFADEPFLGSAAFAQALTLALFMGGMAGGSWAAGKLGVKAGRLLLWYAVVGAIGVAGVFFHPMFISVTGLAYEWLFPAMGYSAGAGVVKWTLAAAMILPQCVLLGATFPLMSAGIIRRFPNTPGEEISALYFVNSLGASAGVLAGGFYLVDKVGLPGAIITAGVINLLLAVGWRLFPPGDKAGAAPASWAPSVKSGSGGAMASRILACAVLTGLASFLYEIGWIRMLTLALGASSHAFELMLSSFILGLALGGRLIKNRIERLESHLLTLAEIQAAMGALALLTVFLYGGSFEAMAALIGALSRSGEGYFLFNVFSHFIAMAIMLPATIRAGMTLPLMTHYPLKEGQGEESIGEVYAANTLGSIVGVLLGVQILMPYLGLKSVVLAGAAVDMGVGIWLFLLSGRAEAARNIIAVGVFGAVALSATMVLAPFDPLKMASGVYRTGKILRSGVTVKYHKDGRTSSVDVLETEGANARRVISTNGKPDSAIGINTPSTDEPFMILSAALPYDLNPVNGAVAVVGVGVGTGLTTHMALSIPAYLRVDTVEIEPAMLEGARLFGGRVAKVFSDPRSRIHIEDAKSYLSSTGNKYGLILSEPSNPWVSGVAGLFSTEFYRLAGRSLNQGGALAQWIQLYETEPDLVAGIMKAVSDNFDDYAVYIMSDMDMLVLAHKGAPKGRPTGAIFSIPELAESLRWIGVESKDDLRLRWLGGEEKPGPPFQIVPRQD
jgi:hypothetical protein